MATSKHASQNSEERFLDSSGIGQLTNILSSHLSLIKAKEKDVDKIIESEQSKAVLLDAKKKAVQQERELLRSVMDDIDEMNQFLKNIILIENLFNSIFGPSKKKQEKAREMYAKNIQKYENKDKVNSEASNFVELIFGAQTHVGSFQNWIDKVIYQCKKENIKVKYNSNAQIKKIERAFYKAFYVYSVTESNSNENNQGFNEMTDVLRCSMIFDEFDDLYKCFTVIETLAEQGDLALERGILRVKDRFHPSSIEFGYRDLLINIFCPGSKIVCEIQLHWYPLYKYKKISHKMYKIARLFERNDGNAAYKYSHQYLQKKFGTTTLYEPKNDELGGVDDGNGDGNSNEDEKKGYLSNNDNDDTEDALSLLDDWGLKKYGAKMMEEGWDDPIDWKEISENELINDLGFAKGHAKKFQRKYKEWQDKQNDKGKNEKKKKENGKEEVKQNDDSNYYDRIDNGGWKLVRRVKKGYKWHPAKDHCNGNESYGLEYFNTDASKVSNKHCNINHTFSIQFDKLDFDEFLFSSGDGQIWVIASKSDVLKSGHHTGSGMENKVLKSSNNKNGYNVRWFNRKGNAEDPWISLHNHFDSIADGTILYGGNGWGNANVGHSKSLMQHNGANVFIRLKNGKNNNNNNNNNNNKGGKMNRYEDSIDGGGWRLVRRVKKGYKWHPAKDHCDGSQEYGLEYFSNNEVNNDDREIDHTFSIKFDKIDFTQFLFSTGDGKIWVIAKKEDVLKSGNHTGSGMQNSALKSSKTDQSYNVLWFNRKNCAEDPWISLHNHLDSIADGTILYGGNGWGNANVGHSKSIMQHNGANVWIR